MSIDSGRKYLLAQLVLTVALIAVPNALGQTKTRQVRQPREVVEAYRVCEQFQKLMAEELDFDRAFEETFTRNTSRRREVAITEGEFESVEDLDTVDDLILINAFKSRMQVIFLLLPLLGPADEAEENLFFPPAVDAIFKRQPPSTGKEFPEYEAQLKQDAVDLRTHLNQLAASNPRVALRVRDFKADLSKKIPTPQQVIKPLTAYSRGRVLEVNEKYYRIGDFAVIREGGQMKIIGIRFFSRLF